ncbi:methyl-accepting chemotaxis protein [Chthonobacter rhizosphaerae]|uniref:methyl-accepting chemotaxis protein n=1 Tax=Chthonobacter rhizosphaerae TaxID=2735553 RepID=UPI0015EEB89E|nr:methyl-accepting chemotaxis protein [Chthonobacter rhizosphaerae]
MPSAATPLPEASPSDPLADAHQTAMVGGAVDLIEDDVRETRRRLAKANTAVADRVREALDRTGEIAGDADGLTAAVDRAKTTVASLTRTFEDIAEAGRGIGSEISRATSLAEEAQAGATRAGTGVADLDTAIARIESVIGLISKITKQTTLLALNATIEAERAGESGRGFAVVANEVKALSVETQRATGEIRATIQELRGTAEQSVAAVNDVVNVIGRITPTFAAVADAVSAQASVIEDAARAADATRDFVDGVSARATAMRQTSLRVGEDVLAVRQASDALAADSDRSTARLMTVLRQSEMGDRRRHDRFPAEVPVTLSLPHGRHRTSTVDVSAGGLLAKATAGLSAPVGTPLSVELASGAALPARVVGVSPVGVHIAFGEADGAAKAAFGSLLADIRGGYQELIDRAMKAAADVSDLFEAALARGEITEAGLFDTDYRPIAGTDPLQVDTSAIRFLERVLPPVQEALLATDTRMTFCCAVDRNGWLPVHNTIFSKPQRPGDPAWNAANSRNKRIFDDRTGLVAARNVRPFVVQAYQRDMGNGQTVLMKEIDAPIRVRGRMWGGFRTAYRM